MPRLDALPARRPRLLVLTSTYPRWSGDPEPGFVHELSKRLTDHFDVTVLGPHAPGAVASEVLDGVEVVRYRYAPECFETLVNDGGIVTNLKQHHWKYLLVPGFILAQAWWAWRLSRKQEFDIIHAHWLIPQGLIAALLQFMPGGHIPFVVTSHGADLYALRGKLLDRLKRWVIHRSSSSTVVSRAMLENLHGIDADTSKVAVLPMGVDVSDRFTSDASMLRRTDEILFVGRLVDKKGVSHLLEAMPVVLRKSPHASLTIAGFGPQRAAIESQIRRLRLTNAVRFLGAVPQAELPNLYRQAAMFVAPFVRTSSGDEEGLGLVAIEAIGCGCPPLLGNVSATRDLLGEEAEFFSIDPRDSSKFARRILEILMRGPELESHFGRLHAHVVQNFDWKNVTNRYSALLMKAVSQGHEAATARPRETP